VAGFLPTKRPFCRRCQRRCLRALWRLAAGCRGTV
jgi:hypothetical protein